MREKERSLHSTWAQMIQGLSGQMVRVNSWWSVVRDGTSTKGSGTHLGDKIRLLLQVRGPGTAESWMELGGTKDYGDSGRLLGKLRQHESGQ